eukprot:SAG22_NODE_53_length_24242_cov_158.884231_3_plen_126_part_00
MGREAKAQPLAAGLLDGGPAPEAGPGPETTAIDMVDRIFDALDTDGSGRLTFEEVRLLAERTGGVAMTCEEYLAIARAAGFDAGGGGRPGEPAADLRGAGNGRRCGGLCEDDGGSRRSGTQWRRH